MFFSIGNHIGINIPFQNYLNNNSLILSSSGKYKRETNEHTTFDDKYLELPLKKGIPLDSPEAPCNIVTSGYSYDNNFFRVEDPQIAFEIRHIVIHPASQYIKLPDESELYYTTHGGGKSGFICTEPWIGGINSLNTGKGLIKLQPNGVFKWKITAKWKNKTTKSII